MAAPIEAASDKTITDTTKSIIESNQKVEAAADEDRKAHAKTTVKATEKSAKDIVDALDDVGKAVGTPPEIKITIPPTTSPNRIVRSLINGAAMAPIPNIINIDTAHQGIRPPIGTRPNMSIIPATKSRVASKFRIRNAL